MKPQKLTDKGMQRIKEQIAVLQDKDITLVNDNQAIACFDEAWEDANLTKETADGFELEFGSKDGHVTSINFESSDFEWEK